MADLYAELITNVNKIIDPIENGEIIVAKSKQATRTETADNVGNCESAISAGTVNNVNSAPFATAVVDMGIPLAGSCKIDSGRNGSYTLSEDGVYLVVYDCTFEGISSHARTLCGVMVVEGSKVVECPLGRDDNFRFGSALKYEPNKGYPLTVIYWGDYGDTRCEHSNGTLYFYKIGTLQKE